MLISAVMASALLAAAPQDQDQEARVDDVIVEGRRGQNLAREFVGAVSAPARNRGMARWHGEVCVSVANFRNDGAQYIVDRISDVAEGLGLGTGGPGCRANIVIAFTDEADALAATLVEENRRAFRTGLSVTDRGPAALRRFQTSDAPVRWWHVSLPVDSETGARAVRLPGEDPDTETPVISTFAASRLNTQIRDDLNKVLIIVDIERAAGVDLAALADYLAFIAMVQVDAEADVSGFDTVLNLFDAPGAGGGMSVWDETYLTAVYSTLGGPQQRIGAGAVAETVSSALSHERRRQQAD